MEPITNYTNPLNGALNELFSAMSALNMEPNPLPAEKQTGHYLSETDGWAKHSMEHMRETYNQLNKAREADAKLRATLEEIVTIAKNKDQMILDQMHSRDALVAALSNLLETIEAHEIESCSCDRDGETHCDCLRRQAEAARLVCPK